MFGSLGMPELLVIFAVALLVFGPKRLPDMGRSIGEAIRGFKKAINDPESPSLEESEKKARDERPSDPDSRLRP